jgi:hypothetical protein
MLLVFLLSVLSSTATGQLWTWIGGSSVIDSDPTANPPVKGTPSSATWPYHRYHHVGWVPYTGSSVVYMYGGYLGGNLYSDLWSFNINSQGKQTYHLIFSSLKNFHFIDFLLNFFSFQLGLG